MPEEPDGFDGMVKSYLRNTLIVATLLARSLAQRRQRRLEAEREATAERIAELKARLAVERESASVTLDAVKGDEFWRDPDPDKVVEGWHHARAWEDDPELGESAAEAGDRIRAEVRKRWDIGLDDPVIGVDPDGPAEELGRKINEVAQEHEERLAHVRSRALDRMTAVDDPSRGKEATAEQIEQWWQATRDWAGDPEVGRIADRTADRIREWVADLHDLDIDAEDAAAEAERTRLREEASQEREQAGPDQADAQVLMDRSMGQDDLEGAAHQERLALDAHALAEHRLYSAADLEQQAGETSLAQRIAAADPEAATAVHTAAAGQPTPAAGATAGAAPAVSAGPEQVARLGGNLAKDVTDGMDVARRSQPTSPARAARRARSRAKAAAPRAGRRARAGHRGQKPHREPDGR